MSNESICPVTGLPIFQKDDWSYHAPGQTFQITIKRIGECIFLVRHTGFTQPDDVDHFFRLLKLAISESLQPQQTFSLLIDYTNIQTSNLASRQKYISRGLETINRTDIIAYFGMNALGRIQVRMGSTLYSEYKEKTNVFNDYESAIRFIIDRQSDISTKIESIPEDIDSQRQAELLKILAHLTMGGDLQVPIPDIPADDIYSELYAAIKVARADLQQLVEENQKQAQQLTIINQDLEKKIQERTADLKVSQERYRALFMDSPIALYEQDYSQIKIYIDNLRRQGVTDLRQFFLDYPDELSKCRDLLRVIDANHEAMRQNKIMSKEGLVPLSTLGDSNVINMNRFLEEITTLAGGNLVYEGQGWHSTLSGKPIYSILRTAIAPHCEDTWSKVFVSLVDITRQIQVEEALFESQQRYRSLFEDSPIALVEEDFSEIKAYIDNLKAQGIVDFRAFFNQHLEEVHHLINMIKYVEVNQAALDIYQAADLDDFITAFEQHGDMQFNDVHLKRFSDELSTLAEGKTRFRGESMQQTIAGSERCMSIRTIIAPGFEDTWSKILVSFIDITEHKRLENLRRVMAAMTEDLELDQVLERILQYLEQVIHYDSATVYLKEKGGFRVAAERGLTHAQYPPGTLRTPDYYYIRRVVRGKRSVVLPDVARDDSFDQPEGGTLHAWMGIPLRLRSEIVGLLMVGSTTVALYGKQEAALTEDFAHQAAVAIKNATLYQDARLQTETLQKRDQILQVVSTLGQNLLKAANWRKYIQGELERLGNATRAQRVTLYENNLDQGNVFVKLMYFWKNKAGFPEFVTPAGSTVSMQEMGLGRWCDILSSGRVICGSHEEFPPEEQLTLKQIDFQYFVIVPIFVQSEWWGMLSLVKNQGRLKWSEAEIDAMRVAAGMIGSAIERDLTEGALVASQKLADLGTLAAGVAHELNSPLQVITGYSEGLLRQIESNEQVDIARLKNSLKLINRSGWRSADIVRSLLAYTRSSESEHLPVELNRLVHDTLLLVEHQMRSWMNINISTDLAENMPQWYCDSNQITQVLINLLTNARDAMPDGGNIHIQTAFNENNRQFIIKVSDTGAGIPEGIRSKIFNPFFTTKPIGQGTGLGLSILQGIVKAHAGEISVESQTGRGTTFTLIFPEKISLMETGDTTLKNEPGRFSNPSS